MTVIGKLVGTAIAVLSLVSPASAQGYFCDYAPAIVSLSNTVLTRRTELPTLPRRNAPAAEASYLTIMYGALGDLEAEPLLQALIDDRARGVDEVAFAWSYGMNGGDVTERMLGADAAARLVSIASTSAIRALIHEGDEDELLTLLSGLGDQARFSAYRAAAAVLLEVSNDRRRHIADEAQDRGMLEFAALLVALDDKGSKEWDAFVRELNDPALVTKLTQLWQWTPGMVGKPELPRTAEQGPATNPAMRAAVQDTLIAAAKTPQIDFLLTILNQTGEVDKVAPAGEALRAAIESGAIARNGTFGPAWLLEYRVLRELWADDLDYLLSTLKTFDIPTPRGSRKPLEILDHLVAIEALTPYLRGANDELPDRPSELSPDFAAWPQWAELATRVKDSPADPVLGDEADLPIAAELLFAAGEVDALASLLAAAPASLSNLRLAIDMATRLDRMCSAYFYHPTEAVQLTGQPIYKFDD